MNNQLIKETVVGPCMFLYEGAFDRPDEIISKIWKVEGENSEQATVFNGLDVSFRNTKKIDLIPSFSKDVFYWKISQKLWEYGNDYATKHDITFSNMEFPQMLHYEMNDGFYAPHADSGKENPRIFSAVLYLNTVEVGGETYFNNFDISVHPIAGNLVIFPANYAYVHEARKPLSDSKTVIVTWFNP